MSHTWSYYSTMNLKMVLISEQIYVNSVCKVQLSSHHNEQFNGLSSLLVKYTSIILYYVRRISETNRLVVYECLKAFVKLIAAVK